MFRNAGDSDFRMTSVAETIRFSKATVQIQQFKYECETYKQQGHRLRLILVFKIHEIRERTCRRPTAWWTRCGPLARARTGGRSARTSCVSGTIGLALLIKFVRKFLKL